MHQVNCKQGTYENVYGNGYFPKKCYYKKEAITMAQNAKKIGAKSIVVTNVSTGKITKI
jgi:hypothetical protein